MGEGAYDCETPSPSRRRSRGSSAIVGGRGTNKTSCFDFALAPIREKDDEQYERYVSEKALQTLAFHQSFPEDYPRLL